MGAPLKNSRSGVGTERAVRMIIRPWRKHESERIRSRSTSIKAYRRLIFRRWKQRDPRRLVMIDPYRTFSRRSGVPGNSHFPASALDQLRTASGMAGATMKPRSHTRWALLAIVLISLYIGVAAYIYTSQYGFGLLGGLISFLILVTFYSVIAPLLGWPRPKWSDVWAIDYLLP